MIEKKECSKCQSKKTYENFVKASNSPDGLYSSCKECNKTRHQAYSLANKAKLNARSREWDVNNRDIRIERNRIHYQANKEAKYEKAKVWNANNRPSINASAAKRRSAKLNATVVWSNDETIKGFYALAEWLTFSAFQPYEVDHIVPLQGKNVCGLHCEDNLQVIPMEANRIKANNFIGE